MKTIYFLTFICISTMAFAQNSDLIVKTANGTVEGVTENNIRTFKGIPFAQPPVGDLRWKEPQPVQNWQGVRKADHFGPRAMQRSLYADMIFHSDGVSEDCLYLNIWAPPVSAGKNLPVLVYFYGGGLITGDGSEFRYAGETFAKKGIIAITINYRLGVFGFMARPALTAESKHHSSGNYGLMDQTEALRWVQKNISAFGGDPKKVTIGGESAGSFSVSAQIASPLAKGLFAGAIGESGSLLAAKSTASLNAGEEYGTKFMTSVGASSLEDLRKMPADKLLEATAKPGGSHFSVTVDGYFFPEAPAKIYAEGKQNSVPLLVGWNSAEADYTALLPRRTEVTVDNYKKALQTAYGDHSDEVFKVYPANTPDEIKAVATDLASDRMIAYGTWLWTSLHAATSHKPVYHYIFDHPRPQAVADAGKPLPTTKQGARHSWEIEYALGNLATNKTYAWNADDYKISDIMNNYFTNFIKTGNPNGNGLPNWEDLQKSHKTMWIDVNTRSEPFKDEARYQVLKSLDHL